MKKSICALLCVLILLGSATVVGAANQTHVSGCECAECAGEKDISDITYVPPSIGETTMSRDAFDDVVSKYLGDQLSEAGKDFGKTMNFAEKFIQMFRDICQKLAEFADSIGESLRKLIKR